MPQPTRALIGFLTAPVCPGVLLYLYNYFWKGYGDASVVGPAILIVYGYAAALILGMSVYSVLQRKAIRSLAVYGLLGALIGPVFFVLSEVLTAYPGTYVATLRHGYGLALVASVYSSLAAIAFWAIAFWPWQKSLGTR